MFLVFIFWYTRLPLVHFGSGLDVVCPALVVVGI
jgi:hypothetical protein